MQNQRSNEPGIATRVADLEYTTGVDGSAGLGLDPTGKMALVNHAEATGKYGKASASKFGHVKLVDDVGDGTGNNAGLGAADGVAASGSALQKLKESVQKKLQETVQSVESKINTLDQGYATDKELTAAVTNLNTSITNMGNSLRNEITAKIPLPATTSPRGLGTAAVGTSTRYAREDHVHPGETGAVKVSTVVYCSRNTPPEGYLVCNGGAYSSTTYRNLYNEIGTRFGGTSSNFKVPDLIGKFPEGDTTVGTVKSAGLPNITGRIGNVDEESSSSTGAFYRSGRSGKLQNYDGAADPDVHFDASRSSPIYGRSNTVQPPSLTLLPCIKY